MSSEAGSIKYFAVDSQPTQYSQGWDGHPSIFYPYPFLGWAAGWSCRFDVDGELAKYTSEPLLQLKTCDCVLFHLNGGHIQEVSVSTVATRCIIHNFDWMPILTEQIAFSCLKTQALRWNETTE